MLTANTYSLDDLVSFNIKSEDYFTNSTTKAVNTVYETFLSKNITKLKNKDKSVLKEINKINVNYILIDNLNYLWNSGFNTNTNTFSSNVLATFKLTDKEKIDKNKKLTTTLKKEDIKIARDIRKTDIAEKKKTLKILKQDVITSDFGQTYLQERNKEIAKNFTNTYKEKIFSSINSYFNQKLSITREKNLINHLSFKRLRDLSKEEKAEYINEYDNLQQIYGLKTQSLSTYDSLKFNPKERIRRIAKTELSAAYNLARYDKLVNQGYIEFQIKNRGKTDCVLCLSKNNEIITISQITSINRGFTDFKGIDTRKDKNAYENRNLIFPTFHPNCFVAGTKILMGNGDSKNIEDVVIGEDVVVGLNTDKTVRMRKVYNAFHNVYNGDIITLVLENGKRITATANHEVFDGQQFRHIKDFNVGDFTYTFTESDTKTYRTSVLPVSKTEIDRQSKFNFKNREQKCNINVKGFGNTSNQQTSIIGKKSIRRIKENLFRSNENKQSCLDSRIQRKNVRRYIKIQRKEILSKCRWIFKIFQNLSKRFRYDFQKLLGSQCRKDTKSFKTTLVLREYLLYFVRWYSLQTRLLFTQTKLINRGKRLYERRFTNKNKSVSTRLSSNKIKNNRRKEIPVSTEIFSGLTKLRVKEIQKEYYEGLVYNISVDESGDYNYYFASTDNCFVLTHNCTCSLIGVEKTKTTPEEAKTSLIEQLNNTKNLYEKATAASSIISLGSNLAGKFLALQQSKKDKEEDNLLKMIIAGGSIMSMSMMYYFFTKTQLGTTAIQTVKDKVSTKASDLLLESSQRLITTTTDTLQKRLREAVLNKDYIQTNLAETGFKPPTNETLSQYLNKQQREIINNQLSTDIQKYITKSDLEELLKKVIINAENITNLRDLGKGDLQQVKLIELEILLNALLINNKTNNKQKLIDIIYNKIDIRPVVAKVPLNIKEPDYVLIQNTENKLVNSTTRLERLGTNITKLNSEIKKNKSTYLKDIETLRELDSELTEQLIGIERINTEYTQLLETTTDKNLSRYLADKVTENNQKTSKLRNKLNDISSTLYGTKLDKIDPNLKSQLITNIKDKGKQYLEFKNYRVNKINSIITTLNNYKKDISLDKLNIEYIDNKLAEVDKLDISLRDLNKNSLVLDNMLSDYAILSKIDNTVNIDDLGYTFKNYLDTSNKRGIASLNVDNFRETSLTNTKVNLDNYKKKLIQAKYKLLNNEAITEFKINLITTFKKPCHIKLKNIIEKLKKV